MSFRGISAMLLFSFTIPIVMKYRILPIEGTPYWLFGILFLCLIGYSLFSIFPEVISGLMNGKNKGINRKHEHSSIEVIRTTFLWVCIAISLGGASITAIVDRHNIAPIWGTHDIILQQEAAIRYLIQRKNPYKETYFGTPVEMFRYEEIGNTKAINPALYHFVMPPGYLVLPLPFYWVANRMFGYFDGRMLLLFLMTIMLYLLSKWFKRKDIAELAVIITALSPAATDYFIEGRSDLFALVFLIGALFFLNKKTLYLSLFSFSLAILSKQTMWFATPLYLTYVYVIHGYSWKKLLLPIAVIGGISMVVTGPFLVWDFQAFLSSVVFYLSAGGPTGYPVSGYGLSMILYSLGVIRDVHAYYPFQIWQFGIGIPVILLTVVVFLKRPSVSFFLIGFAITLFSFWYTSRYFNNSHIAVVAGLFALGILKKYDEDIT